MLNPHVLICLLLALLMSPALESTALAKKINHSPCHKRSKLPGCLKKMHSTELRSYTPKKYPDNGLVDTMSAKGKKARGFYLTPYWVFKVGAEATARSMNRVHMNSVVFDMKGDLGRVLYASKVELTRGLQKHLVRDPKKIVKTLQDRGLYVIARLVCFKDSRLPYKRPDLAARLGPKGRRLFSAGANWVDAYSPEVQDYLIDLAREIQTMGFDEIQLDYIRFPKGWAGAHGTWLHKDKRDRATLIANFLERMDRAVTIPLSVDVYGLTTLVDGDPRRLGQTIEMMGKYVEAVSPMMYPNGMSAYFKNNTVTEKVYHILHCGIWRARHKVPGIVLRPYLQSYPNNVESFFGPGFIKGQIRACERGGCDGFLFWNSTMRNREAYIGMRQLGTKYWEQFGTNTDQYKLSRNKPGSWCPARGAVFSRPRKK